MKHTGICSLLCLFLYLGICWGATYTFYPKSYVERSEGLANTWNNNLDHTKKIMIDKSFLATHLVKIDRPGGDVYRLATQVGPEDAKTFALDLSPDALMVGGKPVAMIMRASANTYRDTMHGLLNGEAEPHERYVEIPMWSEDQEAWKAAGFGMNAEERSAQLGAKGYNIEHSAYRTFKAHENAEKNPETGEPYVQSVTTIYYVKSEHNSEGGGGGAVTVMAESDVPGTFIRTPVPGAILAGGKSKKLQASSVATATYDEQKVPIPAPSVAAPIVRDPIAPVVAQPAIRGGRGGPSGGGRGGPSGGGRGGGGGGGASASAAASSSAPSTSTSNSGGPGRGGSVKRGGDSTRGRGSRGGRGKF